MVKMLDLVILRRSVEVSTYTMYSEQACFIGASVEEAAQYHSISHRRNDPVVVGDGEAMCVCGSSIAKRAISPGALAERSR